MSVKREGLTLKYAATELQKDREVALTAVKRHWGVYSSLSSDLKTDREILLAAVAQQATVLFLLDKKYRSERTILTSFGWRVRPTYPSVCSRFSRMHATCEKPN